MAAIVASFPQAADEIPANPTVCLVVAVDGKRATGFAEMRQRYPGPVSNNKAALDQAFGAAVIDVRKGQRLKLRVDLLWRGKLTDVTSDSALYVDFSLRQMRRVTPDEILVVAERDAPVVNAADHIPMVVAYRHAPTGETAYNEIVFRVLQ